MHLEALRLEDECIALNTAFHIAGFTRVLGSLWKTDYYTSFEIAVSFYERLKNDAEKAAEALHGTVLDLRMEYPDQLSLRAPCLPEHEISDKIISIWW